jgi:hypothetical protein
LSDTLDERRRALRRAPVGVNEATVGSIVGRLGGVNEALADAEALGDDRVGRGGRSGVVLTGCFPSLTDKAGEGSGTSVEFVEDATGDRGADDEGDDRCGRWLSPSNGR